MTTVERYLSTEEFEELARAAERVTEGIRFELIGGKLGVKAMPDGDHGRIIEWLIRLFLLARPELFLYQDQGLKVHGYRNGRAKPDGSLARSGAFVGQPEWAEVDPVLMVVEVTSYDYDTDQRDRRDKPRAYAEAGIPVYLLIDRDSGEVTMNSEPDGTRYERTLTVPFGKELPLPEPIGVTLDTEPLKAWIR